MSGNMARIWLIWVAVYCLSVAAGPQNTKRQASSAGPSSSTTTTTTTSPSLPASNPSSPSSSTTTTPPTGSASGSASASGTGSVTGSGSSSSGGFSSSRYYPTGAGNSSSGATAPSSFSYSSSELQLPSISVLQYNFTASNVPIRASVDLEGASVESGNSDGPARFTGSGVDIGTQTQAGFITNVQEVLSATTTADRSYLESRLSQVSVVYLTNSAGSTISTTFSFPDPPPPSPTCKIKALNYYLFYWETSTTSEIPWLQTLITYAQTAKTVATTTVTSTSVLTTLNVLDDASDRLLPILPSSTPSSSIPPTTMYPSGWSSAPTGVQSTVLHPLTGQDGKTTMATFTFPSIYLIADITTGLGTESVPAATQTTIAMKPEDFTSFQFAMPTTSGSAVAVSDAVKSLWADNDNDYLSMAGLVYAMTDYSPMPVQTSDLLVPGLEPYYLNPWLPLGCGTRTREPPCKTVFEADYTPVISLPQEYLTQAPSDWKSCGDGLWPAGGYTPVALTQESYSVSTETSTVSTTIPITETATWLTISTPSSLIAQETSSCVVFDSHGNCGTNSFVMKAHNPGSPSVGPGFSSGQAVLTEAVSLAMPSTPTQSQDAPNAGDNQGSAAANPAPDGQAGLDQVVGQIFLANLDAQASESKQQSLAAASSAAAAVASSQSVQRQAEEASSASVASASASAAAAKTTAKTTAQLHVEAVAPKDNSSPSTSTSTSTTKATQAQPTVASSQPVAASIFAGALADSSALVEPSLASQVAAVAPSAGQEPPGVTGGSGGGTGTAFHAAGVTGAGNNNNDGNGAASTPSSAPVQVQLAASFAVGSSVFVAHQVQTSVANQEQPVNIISVANTVITAGGSGVTLSGGQRISAQSDGAIVADDRTVVNAAPSITSVPASVPAVNLVEQLSAADSEPDSESDSVATAIFTLSSQTLTAMRANDASSNAVIVIDSKTLEANQAFTTGGQVIKANSAGDLQIGNSAVSFSQSQPTVPPVVDGKDGQSAGDGASGAVPINMGSSAAASSAHPFVTIGSSTFSTSQISDGGLVIGSQTLSQGATAVVADQTVVLASNGIQMQSTTLPLAMPYMTGTATDGPLPTRTGASKSSAGPAGPSKHVPVLAVLFSAVAAMLLGSLFL